MSIYGTNTFPIYVYRIGTFAGGYWIDSTQPWGTFASTRPIKDLDR